MIPKWNKHCLISKCRIPCLVQSLEKLSEIKLICRFDISFQKGWSFKRPKPSASAKTQAMEAEAWSWTYCYVRQFSSWFNPPGSPVFSSSKRSLTFHSLWIVWIEFGFFFLLVFLSSKLWNFESFFRWITWIALNTKLLFFKYSVTYWYCRRLSNLNRHSQFKGNPAADIVYFLWKKVNDIEEKGSMSGIWNQRLDRIGEFWPLGFSAVRQ